MKVGTDKPEMWQCNVREKLWERGKARYPAFTLEVMLKELTGEAPIEYRGVGN